MWKSFIAITLIGLGFVIGEAEARLKLTMWGIVWQLEPKADFPIDNPISQLVKCPNGDLTFGPWHVRVIYDHQAPLVAFLQERGR